MFHVLVFGEGKHNKPNSCYVSGIRGCKNIVENYLGDREGIPIYNYTVVFDDDTEVTVSDTIYALA